MRRLVEEEGEGEVGCVCCSWRAWINRIPPRASALPPPHINTLLGPCGGNSAVNKAAEVPEVRPASNGLGGRAAALWSWRWSP